jgi:ribosomal protein S18 acetylase RimI-like enzyme
MIPLLERQADTIVIREATGDDAVPLAAYFTVLTRERTNNTSFRASLLEATETSAAEYIRAHAWSDNTNLLFAFDGKTIVGLVAATGDNFPFRAHNAALSINVHSDYRGRGLGSRLFEPLLAWVIDESRIRRLYLEVLERNTSAIGLYEKYGFEVEGQFKDIYYLDDEDVPSYQSSLIMARYF